MTMHCNYLLKMLPQVLTYLFFILYFSLSGSGQNVMHDTIMERRQRATNMLSSKPDEAIKLLEETLELAKKEDFKMGQYFIYETFGFHYLKDSKMEEAIEAYQKTLSLAQEIDSIAYYGYSLQHLGNVYIKLGRFEKAEPLIMEAYDIFKSENDPREQANAVGSLARIYMQSGEHEKAIENYLEAYQLFDSIDFEEGKSIANLNISYFYLIQGDGEKALPYIHDAIEYSKKTGNIKRAAMGFGNLGYAYNLAGNYQKAFENYQMCADTARKYQWPEVEYTTYKDMSDTYLKINEPAKALEYFKKYNSLRDSVVGKETQERIAELEVQFETERQQRQIQELKQQQKIHQLQLWSLFGGLALLAIIAFLIINRMRSNIRKKQALIAKNKEIHRLEKDLIQNQLLQKELEQQKIRDKLTYQTKQLTDFALDITQKNQLSNDLMDKINHIGKMNVAKPVSDRLRELGIFIDSHLRINEGLATFQQNVDEAHLEFNHQLQKRFPDLSSKDLILCSLLRLNLQNKEIATIRGVSDNAVKMARYRLRKKLGLNEEEDIVAFLGAV